jgi:hypothetical protein
VPGGLRHLKPMPTKNRASDSVDELRREYDLASLQGGVRGKYYARATAGTTLVLLERDVAEAFPDGSAVNRALRAFLRSKQDGQPNKAMHPTSRAKRPIPRPTLPRAARG